MLIDGNPDDDVLVAAESAADPDAIALASLGVDLRITQVVNGAVGVHAVLRDGTFR